MTPPPEDIMMRILQINLGHCRAAQDLLLQVVREKGADVVIVSEQWKGSGAGWYANADDTAAICLPNKRAAKWHTQVGCGWVWVEMSGVRIYSCYFSPNSTQQDFLGEISNLERDIRAVNGPVVVAGDFNAKAAEWGSRITDDRGRILCEMASGLGLHVANEGNEYTFRRGTGGSVIDVTFTNESLVGRTRGWRVLDDYSHSDHQYILFEIAGGIDRRRAPRPLSKGWCLRNLDVPALLAVIAAESRGFEELEGAEERVAGLERAAKRACDASMPRRPNIILKNRKPVHWWNEELAGMRRKCVATRRKVHRSGRQQAVLEYNEARREFRTAIRRSKEKCWRDMCELVDRDPWGLPYKIVRQKLRGRLTDPFLEDPTNLQVIVDKLFPRHEKLSVGATAERTVDEEQQYEPFTEGELKAATETLGRGKAPGPGGVPNEVVIEVAKALPRVLLGVYNACLKDGVYGGSWKRQRLVLIPKSGSAGAPSSYRPLCMLDGFGMLMKKLLLQRLRPYLESEETGLSDCQYGFRRGRSTIDAIARVVSIVRTAWGQGSVKASKHVIMVALDVRNAFNSARWDLILKALGERLRVPRYLMALLESYLSERILEFETKDARFTRELTSGVPQGSALGPTMWNAMYDELLRIELPEQCEIVAYADDIAVMVTDKTSAGLQQSAAEALRRVERWLRFAGLELAVHKTEAIFFTRKRALGPPRLTLHGFEVPYVDSLRYLGVWLDSKLTFAEHIRRTTAKASQTSEQLARLMPNMRGPKTARRKLLLKVVQSTLLYGAPIWAEAKKTHMQKLASVQRRSALRVAVAYRTVSKDATLVIAGTAPVDLLAAERKARYAGAKKQDAREATMTEWQRLWDASHDGRWTHRLIPNIRQWIERKHGELGYHLTQLLSGHGCFGKYLKFIKKEETERCHHCSAGSDDAEHTTFVCEAWEDQRRKLRASVGSARVAVDGMVKSMLESKAGWKAWEDFAVEVISSKEGAERDRRREGGSGQSTH